MIRLLSLLLLGQLILTVGLYWPDPEDKNSSVALVDSALFSPQTAPSTIEIEVSEDALVVLNRAEEQWVLSSGLPVDEQKVQTLLDALLKADAGFAIATSTSAARRFEVSETEFERKITLTGAQPITVYLGSAPSYRKLYARTSNSQDIKVIALNTHDIPANEAGWLDRSLLAQGDIETLSVDGTSYQLESDPQLASEEPQMSLAALVQALANLQVTGNVDGGQPMNATPILSLNASGNGQEQDLSLFEDESAKAYFVKSSRFAPAFSISAYDAERLLEAATQLR